MNQKGALAIFTAGIAIMVLLNGGTGTTVILINTG
jgi:hypothetical protein